LYSSVVQPEAHRWHNIKVKIDRLYSSVVQPEAHRWHNIKVKIDSLHSSFVVSRQYVIGTEKMFGIILGILDQPGLKK
jgi:hypothetical protein